MSRDYMPILGTLFGVAMDALNEEKAQINPGQTLARLAARGGLTLTEASAITRRRRWDRQESTEEAVRALMAARKDTPND